MTLVAPAAGQKLRAGFLGDLVAEVNDHETRVAALEATVDTFHNFTVSSPFSNRSSGWLPCQYTKVIINGESFVLMYIVVSGTPASNGQTICTLPVGYRPASTQDFVCSGAGSSTTLTPVIEIGTDGTCKLFDCALTSSNWHLGWQYLKL